MSLVIAQDLLRQYNKNSPYTQTTDIDSQADQSTKKFGTWSYANMYDALYDKYSQDRNFNINMWRQAVKLGEQDQYLAFLEQNKGTTLSDKFYDPQYYDYESMMLELYLPFADATALVDEDGKPKDRTRDVYDAVTGQWVTENLGPMTDRQYIQYQLDLARETRAAEITRTLEQERKDQLGWWGQFGNDIAATFAEFGEGLLSGLTGLIDFVAAVGTGGLLPYAMNDWEGNYLDAFVDYFGENGLTAAEKRTVRAALDEYERTHTHFRDIDGNMTGVGKYVAGIANSIGMMVPAIVTAYFTGGTSLAWMGTATFYTSIFSNNMYENANNPTLDPSALAKISNAAIKTGLEAVIEYALGKLLGGTIQNNLLGLGGGAMRKNLSGLTAKNLTKSGWKYLLKSAGQEGLEEFLQDFSTNCVDQFYGMWLDGYANTGVTVQTLLDSFLIGAASSIVMAGGNIIGTTVKGHVANHIEIDPETGKRRITKMNTDRGNMYIEENGKAKKVRGVTRLYYNSILADFNNSIQELKRGKIKPDKNIALAQEVYGSLSLISQFYSSFSSDRIKLCEMLLDRVAKAERFMEEQGNERAASILSPKTITKINNQEIKTRAQELGYVIENTFATMVGGTTERIKLREALDDKTTEKLDNGGVTKMIGVKNADGDTFMNADLSDEARKVLSPKAEALWEELLKEYAWVFATDGHMAVETKNFAFVPVSWLENYDTSKIYEFFAQTKVLDELLADETLKPMIDALTSTVRQFTKNKDVTAEQALMQFLFNKSVYQKFLLSKAGRRDAGAMAFKDFIFSLHNRVKDIMKKNSNAAQAGQIRKIYQKIKDTMREPTIKAIINWKLQPQDIAADDVLNDRDRQFINQYQERERRKLEALKEGSVPQEYEHLAEDIIAKSDFSRKTRKIIETGLRDNATLRERLQATAILDFADMGMTRFDFELPIEYHRTYSLYQEIYVTNKTLSEQALRNAIFNERTDFKPLCERTIQILKEVSEYSNDAELKRYGEALYDKGVALVQNEKSQLQDYRNIINLSLKYLDKLLANLSAQKKPSKVGAFTVPIEVMDLTKSDIAAAQFATDKLQEFSELYGISAREFFKSGYIFNLSMSQQDAIINDMIMSGYLTNDWELNDYFSAYKNFVIYKLDGLLGNDYIAVPTNDDRDFRIMSAIPAERFLPNIVLDLPLQERNELFSTIFRKNTPEKIFTDEIISGAEYTEKLSAFINFKKLPQKLRDALKDITVTFKKTDARYGGFADLPNKNIVININASNYFDALIHEINHMIQYAMNVSNGFHSDTAYNMPDFLVHVYNEYHEFVEYVFEDMGAGVYEDNGIKIRDKISLDDLNEFTEYERRTLAYCAYMLVQGEVWARAYAHNGKPVHGFTTDGVYLVSPDGKTRFKVTQTTPENHFASQSVTPEVASSTIETGIIRLFKDKELIEKHGYLLSGVIRDTYHSSLSKDSRPIINNILNDNVPVWQKYTAKLDTIIKNPEQMLNSDILAKCGNDLSEGNVLYRVREYIEENFEGISVDQKESTGEYILVDDNTFDDLMLASMFSKRTSDDTSLVRKYLEQGKIPLTTFYSQKQLALLGINPTAYIIISSDVKTETRSDREHLSGALFINANENTSDRIVLDRINHEFRHLLQLYNGFALGFTPDFEVSTEMITEFEKHIPDVFKNDFIQKWAKNLARIKGTDWKTEIVQHVVYYLTGGELQAYSYLASELNIKPVYITRGTGEPTIFLPWYNAKTGEGRHKTKYLAARGDDDYPNGISLERMPKAKKQRKTEVKKFVDENGKIIRKYKNTRRRDYTWEKAKGTNLEIFAERQKAAGERLQMDPDLQDFIVATTNNLDKLEKKLRPFIENGTLDMPALMKWFRKTKSVNDFTFQLLNKYIFKNDYIDSMEKLNDMLTIDMEFYWALEKVLRTKGLEIEYLVKKNDVDTFLTFIRMTENSKWSEMIAEQMLHFTRMKIDKSDPDAKYEDIVPTDEDTQYARVTMMRYFDGSLGGAFYAAEAYRESVRQHEKERRLRTGQFKKIQSSKGGKELDTEENITENDVIVDDNTGLGNDIIAIYETMAIERATEDMSLEQLQEELASIYHKTTLGNKEYAELTKDELKELTKYLRFLQNATLGELQDVYNRVTLAEMTGLSVDENTFSPEAKPKKSIKIITSQNSIEQIVDVKMKSFIMDRPHIQARLQTLEKNLRDLINTGLIKYADLSSDVQNVFKLIEYTDEKTRRKIKRYGIVRDAYEVGKGRVTLPGLTDSAGGGISGPLKHLLTDSNEAFRHDISNIANTERLLRIALLEIEQNIEAKKRTEKAKTREAKAAAKRYEAELKRKYKEAHTPKPANKMHETEFRVTSRKKTTDTPNNFTIISNIDMPPVLRKIFDVSFEELANTEVQFASRDAEGRLYDKNEFKKGEFDSISKHEVNNGKAFYEANRENFLALTRGDVFDIIEFFQTGMATLDGPANKLQAFEIFTIGYILIGARSNFYGWNMSNAEINEIENLYRDKLSGHGIGLNAGKQMIDLINPMRIVQQRMLDDFNITDDELKPLLAAVKNLQGAEDTKTRKINAAKVAEELSKIEVLMAMNDVTERGWGKRWFEKMKSFRYTAMLSSPTTWIRNILSNALVTGLNGAADVFGKMAFPAKGYREGQWALDKVQVSKQVKNFIDKEIKQMTYTYVDMNGKKRVENLFDVVYDNSSRYDNDVKSVKNRQDLFVSIIVNSLEKKYAAKHKWDNKVMNAVTEFVSHRISDKHFIKFATNKYLGKILTIESEAGRIDLSHGVSNEILQLFAEAVIIANIDYMHKSSFIVDALETVRKKSSVAYEILLLWQPFMNSSFVWYQEILKYTPVGMINTIYRMATLEKQINEMEIRRNEGSQAIKFYREIEKLERRKSKLKSGDPMIVNIDNKIGVLEKQIRMNAKPELTPTSRVAQYLIKRDFGKGILGLLFILLGCWLGGTGVIRIEDDDDKFYLYVSDEETTVKLDISNVFGSSTLLIGASIAQLWTKNTKGETASIEEMLFLVTEEIVNGFILRDMTERYKYADGFLGVLYTDTESVLRSFVPQFIQLLVRTTNNKQIKYSPGMAGMWERWINSWHFGQPAGDYKVNPYTGQVETKYALSFFGEFLKSGIFGPKIYWSEITEVERMCRELGVNKNMLTGELTVDGEKYALDVMALNEKYGELNAESLAKIKSQKHTVEMPDGKFKTLSWDKMSDKQRANVLSRTMVQNAEIAKIYIWTQQMGKKFYASNSLWQTLRKLGITQNVYKGDKGFVE